MRERSSFCASLLARDPFVRNFFFLTTPHVNPPPPRAPEIRAYTDAYTEALEEKKKEKKNVNIFMTDVLSVAIHRMSIICHNNSTRGIVLY